MQKLLLFGPPGVGKGTQARRLAAELGVPAIATGDILREAIKSGTDLGQRAERHMNQGQLVPDDVVVSIVEERIDRPDARFGFLLDGFPRTAAQADALAAMLGRRGMAIDRVLVLEAPEQELVDRIAGRRTCAACQASYHVVSRPPREAGRCDRCGGALVQRPDDREEKVRMRMAEYVGKTLPALARLREKGWPLIPVSGVGSVDEVHQRLRAAIG